MMNTVKTMCTVQTFILYTSIAVTLISADDSATSTQFQAPFLGQVTQPEDVGAVHTKAFEALTLLHETNGRPVDRQGLLENAILIMKGGFCSSPEDQDCVDRMTAVTRREFARAETGVPRSTDYELDAKARAFLSPALMEPLERMESIVASLNEHDVNDVVSELDALRLDVSQLEDGELQQQRLAVLSALSVASESAKLWDAVYRDPTHALYGIHHVSYYVQQQQQEDGDKPEQRRRRLDQYGYGGGALTDFDFAAVVLEDFMAGFTAAIAVVMDDFAVLSTNPEAVILAGAAAAIPASMAAFFGGGSDDGGSGYGYAGSDSDDDGEGYSNSLLCSFVSALC